MNYIYKRSLEAWFRNLLRPLESAGKIQIRGYAPAVGGAEITSLEIHKFWLPDVDHRGTVRILDVLSEKLEMIYAWKDRSF